MKNVLLIGIIIIIIVGAVALFSKYNPNMKSSNPTPITTSKTITSNSINIQNFAFNPQALTIKAGTTVTWTNNDSAMHKIRSSTFNSAGLNTGDIFKFTFEIPGTFNYDCAIHPSMTGTIVVQ